MELDPEICYRIIQARDPRYDGRFFTAVTTTGIYCRPVCPSRIPKRENVRFYLLAASAEKDGFRPCRRCRPDLARAAWKTIAPGVARRAQGSAVTLALTYRPPFHWEELMAFLARRAVEGVEEVTDSTYRRSISLGRAKGIIEVRPGRRDGNEVSVRVLGIRPALIGQAMLRIRRTFDLDAAPLVIAGHLSSDARIRPLVAAAPGMRLPLTWDPFEAIVRAVLGQQISVAGAVTIVARLVRRHGRRIAGAGPITHVFPGPRELIHADLRSLGIPASRARTLSAVCRAILDRRLRLDGFAAPEAFEEAFQSIRGIGPWSARYVSLRGLGEPDAFPETDLGIRKALDALGYPSDPGRRREAIARLAPWRGYAAIYFWQALAAGG